MSNVPEAAQKFARPPLEPEEHEALDKLSAALESVLDHRASPRSLIEPAKRVLEAFGEDWSEDEVEP